MKRSVDNLCSPSDICDPGLWKDGKQVCSRRDVDVYSSVGVVCIVIDARLLPGHHYVQLDGDVILGAVQSRMVIDGVSRSLRWAAS